MSKYAIWDKKSDIITPVGTVFTAEEWKNRYPVAKTNLEIVCGGGVINGSIFGVLDSMVDTYEKKGCDFSNCKTSQDKLDAIEKFEDSYASQTSITVEERIAAALEAQVMMAMDNEEV